MVLVKYNIAVIDNNDTYLKKLFSYMEKRYEKEIQIFWIANAGNTEKRDRISECEIILASEGIEMMLPEDEKGKLVYLTEKQTKHLPQKKCLFLYQPLTSLYQEIMVLCNDKADKAACKKVRKNVEGKDLFEFHMEAINMVDKSAQKQQECGQTQVFSSLQEAARDSIRRKYGSVSTKRKVKGAYLIRKNTNEKIYINRNIFKIGKDRKYVDYCIINNPAISRNHADIIRQEDCFYIIDNQSLNHTYINGVKIPSKKQCRLQQGNRIILADEIFEFQVEKEHGKEIYRSSTDRYRNCKTGKSGQLNIKGC